MRSSIAALIILTGCTFATQTFGEEELSSSLIDITTTSGKKYPNCKIIRVEPDGLVIMHEIGVKKLLFSELPNDLRQQHEVTMPWFIKPEVAAHYWPTSIGDVLEAIAPEITLAKADLASVLSSNAVEVAIAKSKLENVNAINTPEINSAKLNFEQATKELESQSEHDMNYWYAQFGSDYILINGKPNRAGPDFDRLLGKVLSVADPAHVFIIDKNGEIMACRPVATNLTVGTSIKSFGRPIGSYKYKPAVGAVKQVKYYDQIPLITLEQFKNAGEQAFPEIEVAKRTTHELLVKSERETREALIAIETSAAQSQQIAQEALEKAENIATEAEKKARERLLNAGQSTYEKMLEGKVTEEANQSRQRASSIAQKVKAAEVFAEEQEARNRVIKTAQDAETQRALEAQQKRFKIKGPDDFR